MSKTSVKVPKNGVSSSVKTSKKTEKQSKRGKLKMKKK